MSLKLQSSTKKPTGKKKIALVIRNLQGGGGERVVITLAKALTSIGCQCHIFLFDDKIELPISPKTPIHIFPENIDKIKGPLTSIIPKTIRKKRISSKIDRFIINKMGEPNLVLSNLMKSDKNMRYSKLNVFIVLHTAISLDLLTNISAKKRKARLSKLSRIYTAHPCITVSRGVEADYTKLFPNNQGGHTIYNPIDIQQITQSANSHLDLSVKLPRQKYFIHVGRFAISKRHNQLLHAYAQSKISTPLVLVGQGPTLEKTKLLAEQLKIQDQIIFAGFQENPYPLIKNAKCFVLSSDYEALGMVLLEAITLNTPTISTDCPSGPSEILPKTNLAPLGYVDLLADLIKKADNDPQRYQVSLSSQFTLDTAAQSYVKLCL